MEDFDAVCIDRCRLQAGFIGGVNWVIISDFVLVYQTGPVHLNASTGTYDCTEQVLLSSRAQSIHHRRRGVPIESLNISAESPAAASQTSHVLDSDGVAINSGRDDPVARKAYIQAKIASMKAELRRKKLAMMQDGDLVQRALPGEKDASAATSEQHHTLHEPVVVERTEEQSSRAASVLSAEQHARALAAGTVLSTTDPNLGPDDQADSDRAESDQADSERADPLLEGGGWDSGVPSQETGRRFVLASLGGAQRLLVERDGGAGAMPTLPSSPSPFQVPAGLERSAADSGCRSPADSEAGDVSAEATEPDPLGAPPAGECKEPGQQQRRVRFVSPRPTQIPGGSACGLDAAPDPGEQARPRVSAAAGTARGDRDAGGPGPGPGLGGGRSRRAWTPAAGGAVAAVTRTRPEGDSDSGPPRLARRVALAASLGLGAPARSRRGACASGCAEPGRSGESPGRGGCGRARVRVRLDDAARFEIATEQSPWL